MRNAKRLFCGVPAIIFILSLFSGCAQNAENFRPVKLVPLARCIEYGVKLHLNILWERIYPFAAFWLRITPYSKPMPNPTLQVE